MAGISGGIHLKLYLTSDPVSGRYPIHYYGSFHCHTAPNEH